MCDFWQSNESCDHVSTCCRVCINEKSSNKLLIQHPVKNGDDNVSAKNEILCKKVHQSDGTFASLPNGQVKVHSSYGQIRVINENKFLKLMLKECLEVLNTVDDVFLDPDRCDVAETEEEEVLRESIGDLIHNLYMTGFMGEEEESCGGAPS